MIPMDRKSKLSKTVDPDEHSMDSEKTESKKTKVREFTIKVHDDLALIPGFASRGAATILG